MLKEREQEKTGITHHRNLIVDLTSEVRSSHISLALSLIFWLAAGTSLMWSFQTGQSIGLRLFAAMATIWTGLWTAYLAQDQDKPRLAELTVLSALIGSIGMLITASTQLGLPLETAGGIAMFSGATLIVAYLTYSRIALMGSITALLCWAALHLDGYLAPSIALLWLPTLWCGQVWLAAKLKSHVGIFAATLAAYAWVAGFGYLQFLAGNLSPLFFTVGTLMVASVHFRLSQAAEDEGFAGMGLHSLFSWSLAFIALLGLQHYCLHPELSPWNGALPTAPMMKFGWLALVAGCLGFIALAGLVQRRHGHMTLLGIGLMTALYALIPAGVWFRDILTAQFELHMGLAAFPGFGLFLGGVIFASAFVFALNSVRRSQIAHALFALAAVALEADLVLRPQFFDPDYLSVMLSGFILGIAFAVMLAKSHFDPSAPARNLQSLEKVKA